MSMALGPKRTAASAAVLATRRVTAVCSEMRALSRQRRGARGRSIVCVSFCPSLSVRGAIVRVASVAVAVCASCCGSGRAACSVPAFGSYDYVLAFSELGLATACRAC